MTAQASVETNTYSNLPLANLYRETVEFWKKNYDDFIENAKELQIAYGANDFGEGRKQSTGSSPSAASAYEAALSTWQKSIQELLGHFYKDQIEAYRFFSYHLEQYPKLHDKTSRSHSITEVAKLQTAFFRQLANDLIKETEKLTLPVVKLKPNGAGAPNA